MNKSIEEGGVVVHNDQRWVCVLPLAVEKRGWGMVGRGVTHSVIIRNL